jgi:hypothetical protein
MIGPQLEYPVEGIGKRSARLNLTIYKVDVTNKHVRDFSVISVCFRRIDRVSEKCFSEIS